MQIDDNRLTEIMRGFDKKKALVIGDLCLDEYIYGTANSLSPEAPIPRVVIDSRKYVPGAAGNVACSLSALGAQTTAFGILGSDEYGMILLRELKKRGISAPEILDSSRHTPTYSRVVVGNSTRRQQLVRFDLENNREISEDTITKILGYIEENKKDFDAVIFADYDEIGNGLARPSLISRLAEISDFYGNVLVGISRKRINQLRNFSLLIANEREARQATGLELRTEPIQKIGEMLARHTGTNIVITRGEEGLSVFDKNIDDVYDIPSFARSVIDVTGAGDSLTATMALSLASGSSLSEAAYLGSYAAAVAVGKEGTATVTREEIARAINEKYGK